MGFNFIWLITAIIIARVEQILDPKDPRGPKLQQTHEQEAIG